MAPLKRLKDVERLLRSAIAISTSFVSLGFVSGQTLNVEEAVLVDTIPMASGCGTIACAFGFECKAS